MFRFARALEGSDELRVALTDPALPVERRLAVVDQLTAGRSCRSAPRSSAWSSRPDQVNDFSAIADRFLELAAERARARGRRGSLGDPARRRPDRTARRRAGAGHAQVHRGEGDRGPHRDGRSRRPHRRHRHRRDRPSPPRTDEGAALTLLRTLREVNHTPCLNSRSTPTRSQPRCREHIATYTPSTDQAQVGRVLEVGDGIARVAGLPETSVNELLEFESGVLGLALNLDESSIGAWCSARPTRSKRASR